MTAIIKRDWPPEIVPYLADDNTVRLAVDVPLHPGACPNCSGAGMMLAFRVKDGPFLQPRGKDKWLDGPRGSGWYSGELLVGDCPSCRKGRMEAYLAYNCGLEGADLDLSFDSFRTSGTLAPKRPALDAVRTLLGHNTHPCGFLYLYGVYGCGKTHLLKALVNAFRHIKVFAKYVTMTELLDTLRSEFSDFHGRAEALMAEYARLPVLCLDEIDKVSLTGWVREQIHKLIDDRYSQAGARLTVLAGNVAPQQFPADLGYLVSRIRGGQVVEVAGPDMRPAVGLRPITHAAAVVQAEEDREDAYSTYPTAQVIRDLAGEKSTR